MNRMRIATLALALTATLPTFAESLGESSAETPAETASRLLRETLAADHGPGMMAAAVRDGCLIWSDAAGYADLEQQVPLTTNTRMRIGSVSKTLTAALVLRLIQAGRMDPDADIRTWVPEFPDKGAPITPRMLATHTSGIRHYDFGNYTEANNVRYYELLADGLGVFADDELVSEPGTTLVVSKVFRTLLAGSGSGLVPHAAETACFSCISSSRMFMYLRKPQLVAET